MRGLVTRAGFGRCGAALVLSAVLASPALPARAEEGGLFGFLSAALGGGEAPAPAAAAAAPRASEGESPRPLTVRRTAKKPGGPARARLARIPAKTGPVSIFEDPTLRSGDAVMTKDGMKVFAGGRFAPDRPYADSDFVAVSASKSVAPSLRKTVLDLNKLPHG